MLEATRRDVPILGWPGKQPEEEPYMHATQHRQVTQVNNNPKRRTRGEAELSCVVLTTHEVHSLNSPSSPATMDSLSLLGSGARPVAPLPPVT